jgi:hypothetical protein
MLWMEAQFAVARTIELKGILTALAGSDANRFFEIEDEDFSISNRCGFCCALYGVDDFVGAAVFNGDLDANLGDKINLILAAAVELGMTFLTPEAFHLADGHSDDAEFGQSFFHVAELEGFNHRDNQLHSSLRSRKAKHPDDLVGIGIV